MKTSVSYLKNIFNQRRHLNLDKVSAVAKVFELSEAHTSYLTILIVENTVQDQNMKVHFQGILGTLRAQQDRLASFLDTGNEDINDQPLCHWLDDTILTMSKLKGFSWDLKWIHSHLLDRETVGEDEVKNAILRLVKSGHLKRSDERYATTDKESFGTPNPYDLSSFKIYRTGVKKAYQVMANVGRYKPCMFFMVNYAVDQEAEKKILDLFSNFMEKAETISRNIKGPDRVISLSNNLFSLVHPARV